ncbi:MAG: GLPGLI family protein [Alcanivoracaceae bacterium]|nr:GLPGLI family protein [Alcanivoracaceae bacterium]
MNKFLLLTIMLFFSISLQAKSPSQGIAIYKQSINIHASLPKSQAALKAMIPEFQYMQLKISFKNNLLRMETMPPADKPKGNGIMVMTSVDNENTVLNVSDKLLTQYGTVMDIDYLYKQNLGTENIFKFVDEVKTIYGYSCKKAIDEENDFTIWYQQDSSLVIVPSRDFVNIPGLVVKVEGPQISYDLLSLTEGVVDEALFAIPEGHKEISYEQFQDLQEEAMEELLGSQGTNSKMIKSHVKKL